MRTAERIKPRGTPILRPYLVQFLGRLIKRGKPELPPMLSLYDNGSNSHGPTNYQDITKPMCGLDYSRGPI